MSLPPICDGIKRDPCCEGIRLDGSRRGIGLGGSRASIGPCDEVELSKVPDKRVVDLLLGTDSFLAK